MRLESALGASREGITAHGQAIAVVGDNVANASTTAFKRSRIEFQDLLPEGRDGGQSGAEPMTGNGVKVAGVRALQDMGILEATDRALDVGIAGKGYFMVGDPANPLYSRAGNLNVDANGVLVDVNGLPILGTPGTETTIGTLNVNNISVSGTPTTTVQMTGNVDAASEITVLPTNPDSFKDLGRLASFVTSGLEVYDNLGAAHALSIYYFKTAANTWTAQAYMDGGDISGGTAGTPVQVGGNATLTFSNAGVLEAANQGAAVITGAPAYGNGAAAGNFTVNLGTMTQYAAPSIINSITQDGRGAGLPKDYAIDQNGGFYVTLSSGVQALVGTIHLANFPNAEGLTRTGEALYRNDGTAGTATTGTPGSSGLGELKAGNLERSTVDIANEFVDLIVYQKGYQANSQILNAASQMLRDTFGLIR